jgi:para-nitrobenzyl esterase
MAETRAGLTGAPGRRMAAMALIGLLTLTSVYAAAASSNRVHVTQGIVEGVRLPRSGVRVFRGIPYAAPPVGSGRWRPPQPLRSWPGVRSARTFGPRCMQEVMFADKVFRSHRVSEDCLYLNVWAPAESDARTQPVLVYLHGGGLVAGDGSEPKFDGESLARRGIVVVTVNYRLGVFGFLAHPELSKESSYGGSGNYGLLDQAAALHWVHDSVAAFGGDPHRVTIGGVSAGSVSVSALMASPLTRNLIAGAIGESGSILGTLSASALAAAEADGRTFAAQVGAAALADLRALSAAKLLEMAGKFGAFQYNPIVVRFTPTVDGYFFPKAPAQIFAAGEQAHVPLLVGSNSEEMGATAVLGDAAPTIEAYRSAVSRLYGAQAEAVVRAYPAAAAGNPVLDAAQALGSDRFTGYSTWKWIELSSRTGNKPTFYYYFTRPTLLPNPKAGPARARGARHSAEIEYVLGNLDRSPMYAWTAEDRAVSEVAQGYFVCFIESGDPNTTGLPTWPPYSTGRRMILDVQPRAQMDAAAVRGRLFDDLQPR